MGLTLPLIFIVWGAPVVYLRIFIVSSRISLMQTTAQARRGALVIGQNAYSEFRALNNPELDATRMAKLLDKYGFEVIGCDGKKLGCFNLDRGQLIDALTKLEQRAAGTDLVLVFFAGHGLASDKGNILTPVDAKLNCSNGAVANRVVVERIMAATNRARHKLLILDACRDNPVGEVCPNLKGKKFSFLGHGNIASTSGYLHARPDSSSGLKLDAGVFLR